MIALTLGLHVPATAGPLDDVSTAARIGDCAITLALFRTLADRGHTHAQYDLGIVYVRGQSISQDYAEGMKWIRLAADKGLEIAQTDLAIMLRHSLGVGADSGGRDLVSPRH